MPTFTKGPWKVLPGKYEGSRYRKVVGPNNSAFHAMVGGSHVNDEQMDVDARLIAAAPMLYEAVQEAYHELRVRCGYKDGDHCYDTLRAALALADDKGGGA